MQHPRSHRAIGRVNLLDYIHPIEVIMCILPDILESYCYWLASFLTWTNPFRPDSGHTA